MASAHAAATAAELSGAEGREGGEGAGAEMTFGGYIAVLATLLADAAR